MYEMEDRRRSSQRDSVKQTPQVHTSASPTSSADSAAELLDSSRKAFATDGIETFYKPIDTYEGRHRYDPDFEWDAKEEQRIVRQVCSTPIESLVSVHIIIALWAPSLILLLA